MGICPHVWKYDRFFPAKTITRAFKKKRFLISTSFVYSHYCPPNISYLTFEVGVSPHAHRRRLALVTLARRQE